MRIILFSVFAGNGINALRAQMNQLSHEVVLLVTTRGRPGTVDEAKLKLFETRMSELDHDIPVLVVNTIKGLAGVLASLKPDLNFVMNFPFRVSKAIITVPRLGTVNVHPSWLPKYRGPNPFGWQILNKEPDLGLTFHRMDENYDTGPILLQDKTPIAPTDDYWSLTAKIPEMVMKRLPEVLKLVESGYSGVPQNDAESTHVLFFTEQERTIDWKKSAKDINRLIRAAANMGALTQFEGVPYKIWESVLVGQPSGAAAAKLGQPVRADDGSLLVQTGDGLLKLTRYTTAG
jgi:methionyl-tRNA formyltransferase